MTKKYVQIDGLTIEEVANITTIAKEKGYPSLNAFLLETCQVIQRNDLIDKYSDLYKPYFDEVLFVQKAIKAKLEKNLLMKKEILEILENLKPLFDEALEMKAQINEELT